MTLDGEGGEAGKKILVKPENIAEVQADEGAAGELHTYSTAQKCVFLFSMYRVLTRGHALL